MSSSTEKPPASRSNSQLAPKRPESAPPAAVRRSQTSSSTRPTSSAGTRPASSATSQQQPAKKNTLSRGALFNTYGIEILETACENRGVTVDDLGRPKAEDFAHITSAQSPGPKPVTEKGHRRARRPANSKEGGEGKAKITPEDLTPFGLEAYNRAVSELEHVLKVVEAECQRIQDSQQEGETKAVGEEERKEKQMHLHALRLQEEKERFAQKLKKSIEQTRSAMNRFNEENERKKTATAAELEAEDAARRKEAEEYKAWQDEIKRRHAQRDKERAEKEERAERRRLEHEKAKRECAVKQAEKLDEAMDRRLNEWDTKSMTAHKANRHAYQTHVKRRQIDIINEQELQQSSKEQEQSWRRRRQELANSEHEKLAQRAADRQKQLAEAKKRSDRKKTEFLERTLRHLQHEDAKYEHWHKRFAKKSNQIAEHLDHVHQDRELHMQAALDRKNNKIERALVNGQLADQRAAECLEKRSEQLSMRKWKSQLNNQENERRAQRAQRARDNEARQRLELWQLKMQQAEDRIALRKAMTSRLKNGKERMALVANFMKHEAAQGREVDMAKLDAFLERMEEGGGEESRSQNSSRPRTAESSPTKSDRPATAA